MDETKNGKMKNPYTSIIVPVYNAEKWLKRCVDSIMAQSNTDYELLLIDDGSTDGSGDICDRYADSYPNIRTFHKINGGVSSARNFALDNKRGEWVVFVDSDDYISSNYLDNLLQAASDEMDIDLVIDYATRIFNNRIVKEKYPERTLSVSEIKILFSDDDLIWHTSPWGKLYKSGIIDKYNIRFPEGMHIGEDACFLFSYMLKCKHIRTICTCGYNYGIENEGTLTKQINSFESELLGMHNLQNCISGLSQIVGDFIHHESFEWLKATYQRRCLIALYKSRKSFAQRYNFITTSDFSSYLNNLKEDSFQGKVYQFFLRKRMFVCYDLIRYLVSIIR